MDGKELCLANDILYFVQAGLAPMELDVQSLLSLLDQLLVSEISWYNGSLLAESLYTSLYMHDLDR